MNILKFLNCNSSIFRSSVVHASTNLKNRNCDILAAVLGVSLLDSTNAVKIGVHSLKGRRSKFSKHGLNPKKLTAIQANKSPILLIHGAGHNQGVWEKMGKMLSCHEVGPIYTVNVGSYGEVKAEEYEIVKKKIQEIQEIYTAHNKELKPIHLVGYSRGGIVALETAESKAQEKKVLQMTGKETKSPIGKVILIGYVPEEEEFKWIGKNYGTLSKRIHGITAQFDALVPEKFSLPKEQKCEIKTTHLGLPFSKKTADHLTSWFQS